MAQHRYGDNIRSSWSNVLELVLRLDKLDLLPPAVEALIDADVWGVGPPGAPSPTKLIPVQLPAAAGAPADANGSSAAGAVQQQQQTLDAAGAGAPQQPPAAGSPVVSRPLQSARQRRAAAGASGSRGRGGGVGVGGAFLRSVTQLIALQEPEYEAKYATQVCTVSCSCCQDAVSTPLAPCLNTWGLAGRFVSMHSRALWWALAYFESG